MTTFPYDPALLSAVQTPPQSVADVLRTMQTIDATCVDADGLKWFNWLYLQVTQAVETRIATGGFSDPAWLAELDVQFARLYFSALNASLQMMPLPACWSTLFDMRGNTHLARIQFALAGINAHINHDLPEAVVATCQSTRTIPAHDSAQYRDYTGLNGTLDQLVEAAKVTLNVRLLGDPMPGVSHLENTIAAWGVSAARTQAWNNAEILWHLQDSPPLAAAFTESLDGLTTVVSKALLVPVP
jgi:hypothetical protein